MGSPASGDCILKLLNHLQGGVSIQLGSPASGDVASPEPQPQPEAFPFNWDPQRVGTNYDVWGNSKDGYEVSIQLGSPASGDSNCLMISDSVIFKFPFNWDPQRVGT